jgi:phosphoribosyl 1,2-cyclic phosphodiesterase
VYLTHLSHELDVDEALGELPKPFQFAHDGLRLNFLVDR